jgi:hypothetical protein
MNKKDYEKQLQEAIEEVKNDIVLIKNKFSLAEQINIQFKKRPIVMSVLFLSIGVYLSKKRGLRQIIKMTSLVSVERLFQHSIKKYLANFIGSDRYK